MWKHTYDLAIVDNDLDDGSREDIGDEGYFFIQWLRQKQMWLEPIILFTGWPQTHFEGELSLEGLDVIHVQKPKRVTSKKRHFMTALRNVTRRES